MTSNFKEIAETHTCLALLQQLPGNNLSSETNVRACWGVGFLFVMSNPTDRFQFPPPSKEFPKWTVVVPVNNFGMMPKEFMDNLNTFLHECYALQVENTAKDEFLKKHGLWEEFNQYFNWENAH